MGGGKSACGTEVVYRWGTTLDGVGVGCPSRRWVVREEKRILRGERVTIERAMIVVGGQRGE